MSARHHPLLGLLLEATVGRFPAVDGSVQVMPPLERGFEVSFAFTGHAVVATALPERALHAYGADAFGGCLSPGFLRWLGGDAGDVGSLDATLFAWGRGRGRLPRRLDAEAHPRVLLARRLRRDVEVYGDDRGLVTLACGLAGRRELSIEVPPEGQGGGAGRALLEDALGLVAPGEPVFAAVAPGNARSLRAFLAVGFVPIGAEVLLYPRRTETSGASGEGAEATAPSSSRNAAP